MIAHLLRASAIAVAVAALVDPVVHLTARAPSRVAIVAQGGSRRAEAVRVADALEASLADGFDVVRGIDPSAPQTIVIGDRYPSVSLHGRVSTVTLPPMTGPRIEAISAPREVPPATAVHLAVDVVRLKPDATSDSNKLPSDASGISLVIATSGVTVARASHAWAANEQHWRAEVDAVPVGAPPFVLHATLSTRTGAGAAVAQTEATADEADVVVDERRVPQRVLVYEPRPSWAAAFLRRALESDPRFQVSAISFPSRSVSVRAGDPPALTVSSLDDVAAVIVGGLDRLGTADASVLSRFMRERGGALLLAPDSPHDLERSPVRAIAGGLQAKEILLERPAALSARLPLPRLDVSELLTFTPPAGATPLVSDATGAAVVIQVPRGAGALVVSGALDAWRFRADAGVGFDDFWRTLVVSLAAAAPPRLDVEVTPALVAPGQPAHITARVRSMSDVGAISAADDRGQPIRLWPEAEARVFRGTFVASSSPGTHAVSVTTTGGRPATSRGSFVVGAGRQAEAPPTASLALASAAHGGIDVAPEGLARLVQHVRDGSAAPVVRQARRPMHSPWWSALFAVCVCGEWWLRRRRGLP